MVYSWQFLKTFLVTSRKNIRRDLKLLTYEQWVMQLCTNFHFVTSVPCWNNVSLFKQHDNREWPFKKDDEKDVFSRFNTDGIKDNFRADVTKRRNGEWGMGNGGQR